MNISESKFKSNPKSESDNVIEITAEEEIKLTNMFGIIMENKSILEIIDMLKNGIIAKENAPPSFFDGLFYIMENKPYLCTNIKEIDISLDISENYSNNLYNFHSVLNVLILNSNLQKLKLNNFKPNVLVASLATLETQKNITFLNFQRNNLLTRHFAAILRSLPRTTNVIADFSQNNINNEKFMGHLLSKNRVLKSLKIQKQEFGSLDLELIMNNVFDSSQLEFS